MRARALDADTGPDRSQQLPRLDSELGHAGAVPIGGNLGLAVAATGGVDGDGLDVGDRTLQMVRPPVYDSGTTRGLFDPSTGVYWGSDAFAAPMATPVRDVADLDFGPWLEGIATFAQYISPWLALVDAAKYQRTVDRIEALQPKVLAGCHSPAVTGTFVAEALNATRTAPWATVPPQPDQSVLDAIQAVLAAA